MFVRNFAREDRLANIDSRSREKKRVGIFVLRTRRRRRFGKGSKLLDDGRGRKVGRRPGAEPERLMRAMAD